MLRFDPARAAGASDARRGFVLYLEGPRDRGILLAWCRRLLPAAASRLSRAAVILGGRQPARALEHFRRLGGAGSGVRALCLLDRDDGAAPELAESEEPGLEFYTWGRRHIESYLLVPDAIARAIANDGRRVERALRTHLPETDDEEAYRDLDAKRILAPRGPLSRALGEPIPLARVARVTRESELHDDVHQVFAALRRELGVIETDVIR